MMKKIDLISCLNNAWDLRTKTKPTEYCDKFVELIIPAYSKLYELRTKQCEKQGISYNDEIFETFSYFLINLMLADDDFLQGEYEEYCEFCNACGYEETSQDDVKDIYDKIKSNPNVFNNLVQAVKACRADLENDEYEELIVAFCFFSLSGDKEFDEGEYNFITSLLIENIDIYPLTFDELSKIWK